MKRSKEQEGTTAEAIAIRYQNEFGIVPEGGNISFGSAIRAARENYPHRYTRRPRLTLTATGLLESLKEVGIIFSSGAYSELENGGMLPQNPDGFIRGLSDILGLTPKEINLLYICYQLNSPKSKEATSFESVLRTLKHINFGEEPGGIGFIKAYNRFLRGEPIERPLE